MFNQSIFNKSKLLLATGLLTMAGAANAGYTFDLSDNDKVTFGGFIKVDARYVDGDVGYRDFWIGGGASGVDASQIKFFANESRFNTKYVHGDVTGFIELDFFGGGGNEIISNSANPRIRHAFIKYKNITVGQTWSTFMNTSSLAETADFGGPHVGESFVRNTQIRYTNGGLQVSLENPESYGGDPSEDSIPDIIAKYTFKGDWGNVSVGGLARQLNTVGGDTESAFGISAQGRIKTTGKDDIRFQIAGGNLGRYVGTTAARDLEGEEVEESFSVMGAYRHFWNEDTRSTIFYGYTETTESDHERSHWGVNLFKNITKQLSYGVEVGQYTVDDKNKTNGDSVYVQLSAKYVL
jgi:hypothetical protein